MTTHISLNSSSSASGVSATGSGGPAPSTTALTPDALMLFLEAQLQGTDSQSTTIEDQMSAQNNLSSDLSALQTQFQQYSNGINVPNDSSSASMSDTDADGFRNSTDAAFDKAINDAGGTSTDLGQQIAKEKEAFDSTFGKNGNTSGNGTPTGTKAPDNQLAQGDVTSIGEALKNIQNSVGSQSQLQMISLQSLVSQRQMYIQLATNMMQSLDDGTKSITTNIGH